MEFIIIFEYVGDGNWKNSDPDNWNVSTYELTGEEKKLGYKKIDGAIVKVCQTIDNKIIGITTS